MPEESDLTPYRSMKFIMCQSEGGPFDDAAFVAGFYCGLIDRELVLRPRMFIIQCWVPTVLLQQLDLIAMRHDYVTTVQGHSEDGVWSLVLFTPTS